MMFVRPAHLHSHGKCRTMKSILFGAAYYDEYMASSRIDDDIRLMKKANITTVRIAESTWSTLEPEPGVFDFSHIDPVIEKMHAAGIDVIIGTPTYAVPAWLAATYPDVIAEDSSGPRRYGTRQIMDITHPAFLFHAERVIRALASRTAGAPGVIGFQLDNETKYYDAASENVQRGFVTYLRHTFHDDLDELNRTFGLDYWSNRVNAWEDFPDVRGTINASLGAEFDKYRRGLVDSYLAWQAGIVREYARDDQFITQNFDYDWAPGWSYGLQPAVNHFTAAAAIDIAGVDIYHPTQSKLTGTEIAFGGDLNRSIKGGANYLVIETQAQGQHGWLPYPGQLRLQAFSHIASGADAVMYWHWHSIHHSFETYWKGLLSHDMQPNPTYDEAGVIGREFAEHGEQIGHLTKRNRVAIMVSNESLTALNWMGIETGFPRAYMPSIGYNDVLRWVYDAFYRLNVEVDFVSVDDDNLGRYSLIATPALYTVPESTLERLRDYVDAGGTLIGTFRSAVTNEYVGVYDDALPHLLSPVFGVHYNQYTPPEDARVVAGADLAGAPAESPAEAILELLTATSADTLATVEHAAWGGHAAITRNSYGAGTAYYLATKTSNDTLAAVIGDALRQVGIADWRTELAGTVTARAGLNRAGNTVTYLLNYSGSPVSIALPVTGVLPITGEQINAGDVVRIGAWDFAAIVER